MTNEAITDSEKYKSLESSTVLEGLSKDTCKVDTDLNFSLQETLTALLTSIQGKVARERNWDVESLELRKREIVEFVEKYFSDETKTYDVSPAFNELRVSVTKTPRDNSLDRRRIFLIDNSSGGWSPKAGNLAEFVRSAIAETS